MGAERAHTQTTRGNPRIEKNALTRPTQAYPASLFAGANPQTLTAPNRGANPGWVHHSIAMPLLPPAFLPPRGSGRDRLTQPLTASYLPDLPRLRLPGATRIAGRQRFPS